MEHFTYIHFVNFHCNPIGWLPLLFQIYRSRHKSKEVKCLCQSQIRGLQELCLKFKPGRLTPDSFRRTTVHPPLMELKLPSGRLSMNPYSRITDIVLEMLNKYYKEQSSANCWDRTQTMQDFLGTSDTGTLLFQPICVAHALWNTASYL